MTIQQLKDILNQKYYPEEFQSTANTDQETPANSDEVDPSAEPAPAMGVGEDAAEDPADTPNVDETEVVEEWPPCPWIPKSSLRRWKKPTPSSSRHEDITVCFAKRC